MRIPSTSRMLSIMRRTSLVPRPICGRGLVSIVCACAEYPTIRGVSGVYVNSPCNFPLYILRTRWFTAGLQASAVCNKYVLRMLR